MRASRVVKPRSHCVRCRKLIAWYDNIPLVSYIVLSGRCRYCKRRISPRYPMVEALTAAVFCYVWQHAASHWGGEDMRVRVDGDRAAVFGSGNADPAGSVYEGGIVLGLAFAPFVPVPDVMAHLLLDVLGFRWPEWRCRWGIGARRGLPAIAALGGGVALLKIRHREGLGFGDVKLIAMVGSFTGPPSRHQRRRPRQTSDCWRPSRST